MIIDGEKWACEACVRGHRVSNCQHSDRQLQHINKKGRPVSQCSHCRTLRKSRSAHVKCDCGEKTHPKGPCTHLQDKGDSKADHCSCGHGGRCSCALKKEHLDPVPELVSDTRSALSLTSTSSNESRKPRLTTAQSESTLTVFANGHHKPAHKHNQMAHKCGAPYTIPRSNTINGASDFGNRSVDSLPATNTIDTKHSTSQIADSIVRAQQNVRRVKSEQGSPQTRTMSNFDHLNGQLSPLDLDIVTFNDSLTDFSGNGYFTPDTDGPIFSAGLSTGAPVDWSQFNLGFEGTAYETTSFGQPPSYASYDFNSLDQPALSSSTSAETSEVDDVAPPSGPSPQNPPSLVHQQYGSDVDTSELCESDSYRLSTASSYMGLPQTRMLRNNGLQNLDIDDFLKGVSSADTSQSLYDFSNVGDGATSQNGFRPSFDSENSSQKYAPTSVSVEDSFQIPVTGDGDDALWMTSFNPNGPALIADDESEVMEPPWL